MDGTLQRTDDARNTKKMYQANLRHERSKGRSKVRWKCAVGYDIRKAGIVNWRGFVQGGDE